MESRRASGAVRRFRGAAALVQLDATSRTIIADATESLIGHTHLDALSHAIANALVPTLADVSVIDLALEHGRFWRVLGGSRDPFEADANRSAVLAILPPPDKTQSPLVRVMDEGRVLAHGELGSGNEAHASHAVLAVPLFADDVVMGVLSLVTFGRHDRYGRAELTVAEEIGDRLVRAMTAVRTLEAARRTAQEAESYRELMGDTVRTLEAGLADLKREAEVLRAENAAMRAMLEALDRVASDDPNSSGSLPTREQQQPATPVRDATPSMDAQPRRAKRAVSQAFSAPML